MHRFDVRRIVVGARPIDAAALVAVSQQATGQAPVTPALDFSGVIFGNYSLRTDSAAKASLGGKSPNNFTVERAYLNFRMPAGDNGQIRITTDVFQNTNNATNGFYQGWLIRIKYGYLQYTSLKNSVGELSGRKLIAGFRPEHLELGGVEGDTVMLPGRADVVEYLGNEELLHVTAAGKDIVAIVDSDHRVKPGDVLQLLLPYSKLHLFDAESGASLTSDREAVAA